MSYKVKSFIYFLCFFVSAVVYYQVEQQDSIEAKTNRTELMDDKSDKEQKEKPALASLLPSENR